MPFFTDEELNTLEVDRLILHVVGNEANFEPQDEIADGEHTDFFLTRIRDAAGSAIHRFNENSQTKRALGEIDRGETDFVVGARELSRRFADGHGGASSAGAFFVVRLTCAVEEVRFYALIKYDYREAIELARRRGQQFLRTIVQAFVREKRAIQKFSLIRVEGGVVASEVSAFDRMGKIPDLTNYFSVYLDVVRQRDTAGLTSDLNEVLRKTFSIIQESVPNRDCVAALGAAKEVLRGRPSVDNDAVIEAVLVGAGEPDDEELRTRIERATLSELRRKRLDGVEFRPNQDIFRRRPSRRMATPEGVVIQFPGDLEGNLVSKHRTPGGDLEIRVVAPNGLAQDETVPTRG